MLSLFAQVTTFFVATLCVLPAIGMRTQPILSNTRIVQTADGQAAVKIQKMDGCKLFNSIIDLTVPTATIPLPGISTAEWQSFAPCLDVALQPDPQTHLADRLSNVLGTKKRVREALIAADYLDHAPIADAAMSLWAEREYVIEQEENPLAAHLDLSIAQKTVTLTPLYQKLPKWVIKYTPLPEEVHKAQLNCWSCCTSHNGLLMAIGTAHGAICIINRDTGLSSSFQAHPDPVADLHFSPDDMLLFSSARTFGSSIWEVENNWALKLHDPTAVSCLLGLSNDGTLLATNNHENITIKNLKNHTEHVIANPCTKYGGIAIDGTNAWLVAHMGAREIGVWNLGTLERTHIVPLQGTYATKLQFNNDSSLLAACCNNGMVYLLRVPEFTIFASFPAHAGAIWGCAFSACNRFLFTGSMDKKIKIWDLETYKPIKTLTQNNSVQDVRLNDHMELIIATQRSAKVINLQNFFTELAQQRKQFARNTTLEQAQFIKKAFLATKDNPLVLTTIKDKETFADFPTDVQKILKSNLSITNRIKKKRKTADEKDEDYIPE